MMRRLIKLLVIVALGVACLSWISNERAPSDSPTRHVTRTVSMASPASPVSLTVGGR